jgi:hypothetical protein
MKLHLNVYLSAAIQAFPVIFVMNMLFPVGRMVTPDHFAHAKNIGVILLGLLNESRQHALNLFLEIPFNLMQFAG